MSAPRQRLLAALTILIVLLFALRGLAFAQYKVDAWTTEHGLPQGTVISVAQTPDGFIWATTFGGLVRFDGVRFRVFDTATNPELPNSRLAGMFADASGTLWIFTQDWRLLRFRDGKFHVVATAEGRPPGPIIRVFAQGNQRVIETAAGALLVENGRLVPDMRPAPPRALGLRAIGESADGARWFVDPEGLGRRYVGDRLTRTARLPSDRADLVYEDRAGRVWMRTLNTGELLCLVGDTVHRYSRKDGVASMSTLWTREDPDGTLWFAVSTGLVRARDGQFRTFTTADGLPNNYVNSVFRDREGSLWAATQGGLARLAAQPLTTYSVEQGLGARNTYPILQDRRGDIWIGGWQGVTRYRHGVFENVSLPSDAVNRNVLSFAETRDGGVWVGFYGTGARLLTIDGPDARIRATRIPKGGPNLVYAMHESRSGDMWFGGDEGAFRLHEGVFDQPLPHTEGVSAFYEDANGALWIGSTAGLARYADGVVTAFGAKEGFTGKRVRMIHPGANGTLWLGTYDTGLFHYRDGTFTRFTTNEGLPANGAFQILEDAQARFWISSNSGIYRVATSELEDVAAGRARRVTAVRYGRDDGMRNQECNGLGRPAGISAADGRFWFPTQDGVVVLDPRQIGHQIPPPVTILDAAVGGVAVPSLDRIEIRSGSRSVDLHYAALTFVRPELAQFKYRMEGLEPQWNDDTGADRTARYAQLPYGNFRFRVIAANRDGVWNEGGAAIDIIVVPPFWRTQWFIGLSFLAFVATGFGVHRFRLGVLERKRALQQAFARQLIDSQETDRKRIASELHDGVSQTLVVMRNWAVLGEQALPPDSPARRRLTEIGSAASQALGEVREVVQDLVPYHLERLGLVEAMRETIARVADAAGIPITFTPAAIGSGLSTETALRLFRVVQEGLNNVVKHSGATSAAVELGVESGRVRVTIRDNGKGFDPAAVTPTEAGHGFGLVAMSERARMMGGELALESAPGRGTSVTIWVPCDDAHSDSHR